MPTKTLRISAALAVLLALSSNVLAEDLRVLTWNIESGGNDPAVIAEQLPALGRYDIIGLTEVHPSNSLRYQRALNAAYAANSTQSETGEQDSSNSRSVYRGVLSTTGNEDRLLMVYDSSKVTLLESHELVSHDAIRLNTVDFRYRSPLVARFRQQESGVEFLVVLVHLARGKAEFRQQQARGLKSWAESQSTPVFGIGDFNFDFVFATEKGNEAFDHFLADDVWSWVRPNKLVDTNWYDPEPDGEDNYPGSCLDFTFVAGKAKEWHATSRVIERDGDFPDDATTSDHRPLELVVTSFDD